MAMPAPDVLADLHELVKTVSGFKENEENYKSCFKYCLSHVVHDTYPSVNKTTVRQTLDDWVTRFYTHGQFQMKAALADQVQHFLCNNDAFRSNPQYEIEWHLLSFVTALASQLSGQWKVPPLEPLTDSVEPTSDFDWAAYLKEDLPTYTCEDESDSFSSLSSDESSEGSFVSFPKSIPEDIPLLSTVPVSPANFFEKNEDARRTLAKFRELKRKRHDPAGDIERKGEFSSMWETILVNHIGERPPRSLIAEQEVIDTIIHLLLAGGSFDGIRNYSLSFITHDTYSSCLQALEPYASGIFTLNTFIETCSRSLDGPVMTRAYSSCLKKCLLPYELKLIDIRNNCDSLLAIVNEIRPLLPYIFGLLSMHQSCVINSINQPNWEMSLRLLSSLHSGMIKHHREDLKRTFLGMFLTCLAVYGDIADALFTSWLSADPCQEFFVYRETSVDDASCSYTCRQFKGLLEHVPNFVDAISSMVNDCNVPLSLVFLRNEFVALPDDVPSVKEAVFSALSTTFGLRETQPDADLDGDITNDFYEMSMLVNVDGWHKEHDFAEMARSLEPGESMVVVSKAVELAVTKTVSAQLAAVTDLAIRILVDQCGLERHLSLLRATFLINDASLLLPFTNVLFNEVDCWTNADYLTLLIRECASADFSDLADELFVRLTHSSGVAQSPRNVIEVIDCIYIDYHVPYPVSLVISNGTLVKYNAIFRVLLKLKWAHTLSNLPFPRQMSSMSVAARAVSHRLQLLRFACLADLNVVINYFMAQATAELPHKSHQYTNIQTLINDHEKLISKIHARCMLSEGDQHYNLIFDAILPVCFDLRSCWFLQDVNIVSKLNMMEHVTRNTHSKLIRLMPFLERETYVPLATKIKEETLAKTVASLKMLKMES